MPGEVWQFAGSLIAILALAWIASRLKLGGDARLASSEDIARLADEVASGFEPVDFSIDASGKAAILRDPAGRIMVMRRHGSHFAGRILSASATASQDDGRLLITSGEKRYGDLILHVEDAPAWVQAISAINQRRNA